MVRELGNVLAERQRLEAALADVEQRDQLALHDADQAARGFAAGRELGEAADPHDLGPADRSLRLAAACPHDDLADDQPDDQQEHRRLDVVVAVDREASSRAG